MGIKDSLLDQNTMVSTARLNSFSDPWISSPTHTKSSGTSRPALPDLAVHVVGDDGLEFGSQVLVDHFLEVLGICTLEDILDQLRHL